MQYEKTRTRNGLQISLCEREGVVPKINTIGFETQREVKINAVPSMTMHHLDRSEPFSSSSSERDGVRGVRRCSTGIVTVSAIHSPVLLHYSDSIQTVFQLPVRLFPAGPCCFCMLCPPIILV
jgi:hypothetical protein